MEEGRGRRKNRMGVEGKEKIGRIEVKRGKWLERKRKEIMGGKRKIMGFGG